MAIPDELSKIQIRRLALTGQITEAEKQRLIKLFPNSWLFINGKMTERSKNNNSFFQKLTHKFRWITSF